MSRDAGHARAAAAAVNSDSDRESDVDMGEGEDSEDARSHAAAIAAPQPARMVCADPWLVQSVPWRTATSIGPDPGPVAGAAATAAAAPAAADPSVRVSVSVGGPSMALALLVPASCSFLSLLSLACRELGVPVEHVCMVRSTEHPSLDYLRLPQQWPAVWRDACQRASAAAPTRTGAGRQLQAAQNVGLQLFMDSAGAEGAPLCFVDANRQPLAWDGAQSQNSPAAASSPPAHATQRHSSWLLTTDGFHDSATPSSNPRPSLPLSLGLEHWRLCLNTAPRPEEYPAMLQGVMAVRPVPVQAHQLQQRRGDEPLPPLSLCSLDGSQLRLQRAKLLAPLTRAIRSRHFPRVHWTVNNVLSDRPPLIGARLRQLRLPEIQQAAASHAATPIVFDICDINSEQSCDGTLTSFSLLLHATGRHEADGYIVSAAEIEQLRREPYRAWLRDAQLLYLGLTSAAAEAAASAASNAPLAPITAAHVTQLRRAPSIPLFLLLDLDKTVILNEKNHQESSGAHPFECHFQVATPVYGGPPIPVMLRRNADVLLHSLHHKFNIHVLTAGVLEYGRGVVREANQRRWNRQHNDQQQEDSWLLPEERVWSSHFSNAHSWSKVPHEKHASLALSPSIHEAFVFAIDDDPGMWRRPDLVYPVRESTAASNAQGRNQPGSASSMERCSRLHLQLHDLFCADLLSRVWYQLSIGAARATWGHLLQVRQRPPLWERHFVSPLIDHILWATHRPRYSQLPALDCASALGNMVHKVRQSLTENDQTSQADTDYPAARLIMHALASFDDVWNEALRTCSQPVDTATLENMMERSANYARAQLQKEVKRRQQGL